MLLNSKKSRWPDRKAFVKMFTQFLSDPGEPGVRSMGPDVTEWLRDLCVDLTDVTLADEDTNSILTDNAKRVIQGNETMQGM